MAQVGGNSIILGTATIVGQTDAAVAFEATTGRAIVVYDNENGNGGVTFRIWNGAAWSAASVLVPAGGVISTDFEFATMASDPNSNRIILGIHTGVEIWFAIWDGDTWEDEFTATTLPESNQPYSIAVAFESQTGTAIATYVEDTLDNLVSYFTWDTLNGWSDRQDGPDLGLEPNAVANSMTLTPDKDQNRVMLALQDNRNDVLLSEWDGVAWTAVFTVETNTSETGNLPFIFMYDTTPTVEDAYLAKFSPAEPWYGKEHLVAR